MIDNNVFDSIKIGLASPEQMREWSYGEVKKPETINYRTLKPERDGLFCERIFGPTKDWECHCGKYKRIRFKGKICDRCGVEVTRSKVRRERMGHIELAAPVSHIWYFKGIPSRIALMLDISPKLLENVLYFSQYIVTDPGDCRDLAKYQCLTEGEYNDMREKYEDDFEAGMGAEAIKKLLAEIDLDALSASLKEELETASGQKRVRLLKRLDVVESFRMSGNRPEWMILDVVPVIPPDIRPMVQLDGGRFATTDLNDLYRRVINRNNRLKKLLELNAPEIIIRNEKRMLQESVDALIDNGRRGRPVTGPNNRALKSLSDMLKGKQGRFRQNLLGKRVDYSGRSVIVVGPELKMYQCGLPKEMALELFKPFVMKRLVETKAEQNIKSARKAVERAKDNVWDALEVVIKGHPVLLNRAPTLHRLGIQAFEPVLVEGRALKLHPLACTAYNADFDGDQMAVHVPLSAEAQAEARFLMLAAGNLLKPSDGQPVTVPTQDMILGSYYLTLDKDGERGEGKVFRDVDEVMMAYQTGVIELHSKIKVRRELEIDGKIESGIVDTTIGKIIFNNPIPQDLGFIDRSIPENRFKFEVDFLVGKSGLKKIIDKCIKIHGPVRTSVVLDHIKAQGYKYSTKGAITVAVCDAVIPPQKKAIIAEAEKEVDVIRDEFMMGLRSNEERYEEVLRIWEKATNDVTDALQKNLDRYNPIFMMADSGARGSMSQIRQLAGMRGLIANTSGKTIEIPIRANYREGLNILEYFISSRGARKGLADTALRTADSGYLTRRLVDVSQEVIIREEDCGTTEGLEIFDIKAGESNVIEGLHERLIGRYLLDDFCDSNGNVLVSKDVMMGDKEADIIVNSGVDHIKIRSVLECRAKHGACRKCYGSNLANRQPVTVGEAVGIIAAQSIGEPGTQLTLRTFHAGGIAGNMAANASIVAKNNARLEFEELRTVDTVDEMGEAVKVVVGRLAEVRFIDVNTGIILSTHNVPYGSKLYAADGDIVEKGKLIAKWDPFNAVIITEATGKIEFESVVENVTYKVESDEATGLREIIIIESKDKTKVPSAHIVTEDGNLIRTYNLPVGGHVVVENGQAVKAGDIIVKIPRAVGKAGDITGGLPRVTELFEARNPSNPAVVSEIDGEITMGKIKRGNREIIVTSKTGEVKKYLVNLSKQILVQENDYVRAGTPLSDGAITPADILAIKGPTAVQEYIVNEVQDVYRLQGVKINDKHFEIIVRQMMRKVEIDEPGDTRFLEQQVVDKQEFMEENDRIWGKKVVVDSGDSQNLQPGQIVTARKLRDENSMLKRRDLKPVEVRDAIPATSTQILQGITRAALGTSSFMSAASFQETTKVLNEAAINGKVDRLEGMKENVICGHLIPAGTGQREFEKIIVGSKEEYDRILANRKNVLDYSEVE